MWNLYRITSIFLLSALLFTACNSTTNQDEEVSQELKEIEQQMEKSEKEIKKKTDAVEAEIEELLKDI